MPTTGHLNGMGGSLTVKLVTTTVRDDNDSSRSEDDVDGIIDILSRGR